MSRFLIAITFLPVAALSAAAQNTSIRDCLYEDPNELDPVSANRILRMNDTTYFDVVSGNRGSYVITSTGSKQYITFRGGPLNGKKVLFQEIDLYGERKRRGAAEATLKCRPPV